MFTSVAVEMACMRRRGVVLLEFGERVVGPHGLIERPRRAAEPIVEFTQAIERNLCHE